MNPRFAVLAFGSLLGVGACAEDATDTVAPTSPSFASSELSATVGINVVLEAPATRAQLAQLNAVGNVRSFLPEINGLTMQATAEHLADVRALPFVKAAVVDEKMSFPPPADPVAVSDFTFGFSTWNQDAIQVTASPLSSRRTVAQTGEGVYVGILDTGLLATWPQYFPQERIATQYARSFVGGGETDAGAIISPAGDLWQHDACGHGTAVTSVILGYRFRSGEFQGTAPKVTVIPVQFHTTGSTTAAGFCTFFTSQAAAGLLYFAQLKRGPLAEQALVVSNSWGLRSEDPLVRAAVEYTLAQGVLLVFSAGNIGAAGMTFPARYAPVISVAASGWIEEWTIGPWWSDLDVADPRDANDFYITGFSSRSLAGQDLDVAAPGSWVVAPFQLQRGQTSYFFRSGTSLSAPHVAGAVALMLQKQPSLTQAQAESILENSAAPLEAGCRSIVPDPGASARKVCWDSNATGSGLLDAAAAVGLTP